MLGRLLRPTNRRVRLLVGLLLAGLFCIQCTQTTEAFREESTVTAVNGQIIGSQPEAVRRQIDQLARTDHISLLEMCKDNYEGRFQDYTCTFYKQERINGRLGKPQTIDVKFLDQPFSVAMAWTENPPIGDRVLYVEGANDGKMMVRPASGFLRALVGGKVLRQPDDPEAMKNTLRPVNMFGFHRGLENLLEVYKEAKDAGDLEEKFGGYYQVEGRNTVKLIRYLPPKKDYPAWQTDVYIDMELLVPIRIDGYDWDKQLSCTYIYKDIRLNVGLSEADFLPSANGM